MRRWISGRALLLMLLSVLAFLAVVYLVQLMDLEDTWVQLLQKVDAYGWWGQLLFMVVVVVCVIALIPSVLLTLGAGMLFGLVKGSLLLVVAETIGAYVAFLLGRRLLSARAGALLEKRTRIRAVLELPGRHDWRMVALTRMLPFFPFKLSNYLFGLTPLTRWSYVLGTFIGLWPITLFNVYLGSITSDLIALRAAGTANSPVQWLLYGLGLTGTGIVMLVAIRRATREFDRRARSLTG